MINIAILATGQPRSAYIASILWKEYWIDIQGAFVDCNIKTFVSVVNDESVKYTHVEHQNNYSNQELTDLIHHDVIEIYTQEEVTEKTYSKFKFNFDALKRIGHGASWYQLWHLFNAGRMAFEYEKSNNIKFDLFIKIRLDHYSGQLNGGIIKSVYGPLLKRLTSITDYQNKRIAFFNYMYVHWFLFWNWQSDGVDSIKNVNYINDVLFAFSRQAFVDICKNADNQEYTDLVVSLLLMNTILQEDADHWIQQEALQRINIPWLNANTLEGPNGTWLSRIIAQKHRGQITEWINNMWPIVPSNNPITRTFYGRELKTPIQVPTDKQEFINMFCHSDPTIKSPQLLLGAQFLSAEFLHLCYFKAGIDIVFPLNNNATNHLAKMSPKADQQEFLNSVNTFDDHTIKVKAFHQYNKKFTYSKRKQQIHG